MNPRASERTRLVYGGLAVAWVLIVAWQALEHRRVRHVARVELGNRARDISTTLGLVIRSQRRFGGLISKDRIESALNSLIKPGELNAIALLNAAEDVVASAGTPIEAELKRMVPRSEYWGAQTVTLMNLVDLGTNVAAASESHTAIVMPPHEDRPGPGEAPWPPPGQRSPERDRDSDRSESVRRDGTNTLASGSSEHGTNDPPRSRSRRRGDGRFPFGRPFWMSEADYRALLQKQGVHSFVLVLSTRAMQAVCNEDLWGRGIISTFALASVLGLGLAWRNVVRSSDLEVRLARAAELNARLKEMNLAAAGLAHETRNPLNIIRGLAHLITRQTDAPPETHAKSREIIAETDRVTAQLNEFINYSRPREVRWATVALGAVVHEVAHALVSDVQERDIQLNVATDLPAIQGDEQLLRQAFFNLILNAIQAVERGGTIEVAAESTGPDEWRLEVRDDGPGVAPENRTEIFKPYFTTHAEGTGLGLSIVLQIVLAHGWEIECVPNEPRGAVFRIHHIKLARS